VELHDFRRVSDTSFDTDLCIVGTGPAGLAIAHEFSNLPCRVLMIESGDLEPTPEAAELDRVENVGARRQSDQSLVRTRAFGGTSCVWNGRCATLDSSDFETRSWVPLSGWPITHAELSPYATRAAGRLGLLPTTYDDELDARLSDGLPEPSKTWSTGLRSFCWQFSIDPHNASTAARCARSFRERNPRNVRVLLHATATHVETHPASGAVDWLEIRSLTGKIARVRSKVLVLCAGGIETSRLLLASRRSLPAGVGNQSDMVGRCFMDHPRCTLGHFELPAAERVRPAFMLQRVDAAGAARVFVRGLALSAEMQRRESLLSCAGWLSEHHAVDDPWTTLKRLARAPGRSVQMFRDLYAIGRQPRLTARQLRRRFIHRRPVVHKIDGLDLVCDVEQSPDQSSRITLSDTRDALGMPLARIDWRIGELERRTVQRFGQLAVQTFERMGMPAPRLRDPVRTGQFSSDDFIDVAHPSGTTRMASDPGRGVVDEHCQVHGVEHLYVAGTSVFPANGHVNPTLTLVALAIRLADRLKARYFERVSPSLVRQRELVVP
jgi:choline dehydrogenase-like flavoprotein